MSGGGPVDTSKLTTRKRGIKLCILVTESNSCRPAYRFLKAFLIPALDEVHLVTAVTSESHKAAALARQRELLDPEHMKPARFHVAVKEDEYTLFESLGRYISVAVKPDIIFMGSTNLCANTSSGVASTRSSPAASGGAPQLRRQPSLQRTGGSATPAAGGGGSAAATTINLGSSVLGSSCLALRVLSELRCAPVLLAKYNSKGSWLSASANAGGGAIPSYLAGAIISNASSSTAAAAAAAASNARTTTNGTTTPALQSSRPGSAMPRSTSISHASAAAAASAGSLVPAMRVMVDLQPNSRHVLDWLFEHFTAGRDHLVLTVSQAYDDQHHVKPAAQRLLTAFGVQAAVNAFEADTAVLAGPANKSLPQAVMESEPDLLVLQAPRCKGVPSNIVELLFSAKTSFLIWPPDYKPQP